MRLPLALLVTAAALALPRAALAQHLQRRARRLHPRPYQYTDLQGITLAAKYRFRQYTDLTVSYQHDKTEGVAGRDWNHVDNLTRFVTQRESGAIRWNPALERYENANGADHV